MLTHLHQQHCTIAAAQPAPSFCPLPPLGAPQRPGEHAGGAKHDEQAHTCDAASAVSHAPSLRHHCTEKDHKTGVQEGCRSMSKSSVVAHTRRRTATDDVQRRKLPLLKPAAVIAVDFEQQLSQQQCRCNGDHGLQQPDEQLRRKQGHFSVPKAHGPAG